MTDKFIGELPTGTIDSIRASVALELGMPTGTLTIQSSLAQVSQFLGLYGTFTGTYVSSRGYISENAGQMTYITGTSYRVEAGAADVNGTMLAWSSPITRSSLTFTSGTMNYVYLYSNAGTPAVEESTTAPVWDGDLNYYKKTGDNTRRCIGFLQAYAVNTVRPFSNHVRGRVSEFYYIDGSSDNAGRTPVSNQASTSAWTAVVMTTLIPAHTKDVLLIAKLNLATAGDDGTIGLSPSDLGAASAAFGVYQARGRAGANGANIFFGNGWMPVKETQTIYYRTLSNSGSPTAILTVTGAGIIR